jgi:hypothetical protein
VYPPCPDAQASKIFQSVRGTGGAAESGPRTTKALAQRWLLQRDLLPAADVVESGGGLGLFRRPRSTAARPHKPGNGPYPPHRKDHGAA